MVEVFTDWRVVAEERIPYLEGYTTLKHKNTDFIHELFVAVEELVGSD